MSGNIVINPSLPDIHVAINTDIEIHQLTDRLRKVLHSTKPNLLIKPDGTYEFNVLDAETAELIEKIEALIKLRLDEIIRVNS